MHEHIRTAYDRIHSYILHTPLEISAFLKQQTQVSVFLKQEHMQRTGSFKIRGALNKMLTLTNPEMGVVCASTGNHGLAVSYAGHLLNIPVTVYLPETTSASKLKAIQFYGGHVITIPGDSLQAELKARKQAYEMGRTFISPYNDLEVIHGQGTLGLELYAQNPELDAVFVAVGGGGLLSGVGAYLKAVNPAIQIIGCWPENAKSLYECIQAGEIMDVPEQPTLSESTAGGVEPGSVTLNLCSKVMDEAILVSENEIRRSMRLMAEQEHWIIEGAAAVAVAAFLKTAARWHHKSVGIVLCGRNISLSQFYAVLKEGEEKQHR